MLLVTLPLAFLYARKRPYLYQRGLEYVRPTHLFSTNGHEYAPIKGPTRLPFTSFKRRVANERPDAQFLIDAEGGTSPGDDGGMKERPSHSSDRPIADRKSSFPGLPAQRARDVDIIQQEDLGSALDFTFVSVTDPHSGAPPTAPTQQEFQRHTLDDPYSATAVDYVDPFSRSPGTPSGYPRKDIISPMSASICPHDSVSNLHEYARMQEQEQPKPEEPLPPTKDKARRRLERDEKRVLEAKEALASLAAMKKKRRPSTEQPRRATLPTDNSDPVPNTPASTAPIHRSRLEKQNPTSPTMFYPVGVRGTIRGASRMSSR